MRIAILTLPLHTNYGGILQAYALQTVLERMGHDVKVLSPPPYKPHPVWIMPMVYIKRGVEKFIKGKDIPVFIPREDHSRKNTELFIKANINRYFVKDWKKLQGLFDIYVVGSDQIWRPKYAEMFSGINNAFLDFAKYWDIKRIAYAPSFGTDHWEYSEEQTAICSKLLKLFDRVTVREDSGVYLCKEKLDINAEHVLDPTMLLSAEEYSKLIDCSINLSAGGKMTCYILDRNPEKTNIINGVARLMNLDPFYTLKEIDQSKVTGKDSVQLPVEQWLCSIRDAELVITDSFHACVFSIIFHKQFYCILNESRGNSRIYSLMKLFGLENRIISSIDGITAQPVDYSMVQKKLEAFKKQSTQVLQEL